VSKLTRRKHGNAGRKRVEKRKFIVTAALPYVNNVPHLGNLVVTLSGDVFARFLNSKGEDVIYICGSDEHGTTTESIAIKEKTTPKKICDRYFKIHKEIYKWFNFNFTHFGRTSSKENNQTTKEFFLKLKKNGYISEREVEEVYCPKCKRFLADRFVEGTCPYCKYTEARGDQCDACGHLLDPKDLKNARCKFCGTKPEIKKNKHLFLDLPKLQKQLSLWSKRQKHWPENAKTMTAAWLKEGLKPRCITRSLKWGIKVPQRGFEDKVFYSWFDAPIGYISITKEWSKRKWKSYWKGNTKLYQFIGKDNIPFHTIIWPGELLGVRDGYILPYQIASNEYLNYEGGKFSKSKGIGVFGDDAIKTGIPADVWRFYIIANRPETSDYEFTWSDFQSRINNELVANFGNFVNRALSFLKDKYKRKIPHPKLTKADKTLLSKVKQKHKVITKQLEDVKLRDALKTVLEISALGNQYFQKNEPWKNIKRNPQKAATTVYVCANLVKTLSILIDPFLPTTAETIWKQLNLKGNRNWDDRTLLKPSHKIGKINILFNKLEDKQIKTLEKRFSGKEAKTRKGGGYVKFDEFQKMDLRVAKILKVEDIEGKDNLYKLSIDCGDKRTIVAGIKPFYSKEELKGKSIVIVANLEPRIIAGIESKGMLLAAEEGPTLVTIDKDAKPGTKIT